LNRACTEFLLNSIEFCLIYSSLLSFQSLFVYFASKLSSFGGMKGEGIYLAYSSSQL
jgi:hypothetical protein